MQWSKHWKTLVILVATVTNVSFPVCKQLCCVNIRDGHFGFQEMRDDANYGHICKYMHEYSRIYAHICANGLDLHQWPSANISLVNIPDVNNGCVLLVHFADNEVLQLPRRQLQQRLGRCRSSFFRIRCKIVLFVKFSDNLSR